MLSHISHPLQAPLPVCLPATWILSGVCRVPRSWPSSCCTVYHVNVRLVHSNSRKTSSVSSNLLQALHWQKQCRWAHQLCCSANKHMAVGGEHSNRLAQSAASFHCPIRLEMSEGLQMLKYLQEFRYPGLRSIFQGKSQVWQTCFLSLACYLCTFCIFGYGFTKKISIYAGALKLPLRQKHYSIGTHSIVMD